MVSIVILSTDEKNTIFHPHGCWVIEIKNGVISPGNVEVQNRKVGIPNRG
jgi:hypothetical protein